MSVRSHPPASPTAPLPRLRTRWILLATVLGSSMAFIDGTVVNVAVPAIQSRLGATATDAQWIVEGYALMLAGFILVGGALGDRYGRRRVFMLGTALFALASLACGLAPSVPVLIGARIVQGLGGAMLIPGSLSILGASFDGAERGRAIGTWSALSGVTTAGGPVLGGWLVTHASWRWAFFLNLPIALVVLLTAARHVPESRVASPGPLDVSGALTVTLGLTGVVAGALEAQRLGLSHPFVVAAFAIGIAALAAFLVIESRRAAPMVPLALFRGRVFAGMNLLTLFLYGALGGALYFVPLTLIQRHGYTPAEAGAALLPMTAGMVTFSRLSGWLTTKFGTRTLLAAGPAVAALGFVLFVVGDRPGRYWTTFLAPTLVLGIGLGLTVAPLTSTTIASVDASSVGVASGINNAVARAAGALALAGMGFLAGSRFNRALDDRLALLPLTSDARTAIDRERPRLAAARVPATLAPPLATAARAAISDSFGIAFRDVMYTGALLAALGALVGWATVDGRASPA